MARQKKPKETDPVEEVVEDTTLPGPAEVPDEKPAASKEPAAEAKKEGKVSKKETEKAVMEETKGVLRAVRDTITEKGKKGSLSQLERMAEEYQTVTLQIYRVNPKTRKKSLFVELAAQPLQVALERDPHSICKAEGGKGLWELVYSSPDGRDKVRIPDLETEGYTHEISRTEAEALGLDPRTGKPAGVGLSPSATPMSGLPKGNAVQVGEKSFYGADLLKHLDKQMETSRDRENRLMQEMMQSQQQVPAMMMMMMQMNQERQQQQQAPRGQENEELRLLRSEIQTLREQQHKAEQEATVAKLEAQIRQLDQKLSSKDENRWMEMINRLQDSNRPDTTVSALTDMVKMAREDGQRNTDMMLTLMREMGDTPSQTDEIAKVNQLLIQQAMNSAELVAKFGELQKPSGGGAGEVIRALGPVIGEVLGRGAEGAAPPEMQVPPAERPVQEARVGAMKEPERLEEHREEEEPPQEEGADMDETQQQEVRESIEEWVKAIDEDPRRLQDPEYTPPEAVFTEKELRQLLSSSAVDSAVRILASGLKPVNEVTMRLFAVAQGDHPLVNKWLQYPLPGTYQVLKFFDVEMKPEKEASSRCADLVLDIMSLIVYLQNDPKADPWEWSEYRPPSAARGAQTKQMGVENPGSRGRAMVAPLGHKQREPSPEGETVESKVESSE